jgi:sugar lactone lactonase YvrE
MFLADSGTGRVDAFDFDAVGGDISRRRTIIAIDEPGVVPDGLTVDEDGCLWVALWDGGAVHRYGPDGTLLMTLSFPVDRPTSCAFGGPDRSTLFVTTARHGLDDEAMCRQPDAGRLFRINGLGVRGPSCAPYRGRTAPAVAGSRREENEEHC